MLKAKGGKADSLNAGLNIASSELVCAIDADTILDPDGLRRFGGGPSSVLGTSSVREPRSASPTGARSRRAAWHPSCRPHRALAGIKAVEYLRAFLFGRPGWNRLGGNLLISGAFGLFRRQNLSTQRIHQDRRRGHGARGAPTERRLREGGDCRGSSPCLTRGVDRDADEIPEIGSSAGTLAEGIL